ncbi:MAG: response regulator transcription factor [Paludibacteraceae bacterium]|nr:response regulator transcription factor [Paludibacteraceae bacterium]
MNVVLVDDEVFFLENLRQHIAGYMKNHFIPCAITIASNPVEVFHNNEIYDVAFLDIQMDGIDGISLAKELRNRNRKLALFFITNYREYQDDAMDLQAFRFFDKPFDVNRLYSSLDKAMEYIDNSYIDLYLYSDGAYKQVLADEIMYIERKNRKVYVHTTTDVLCVRDDYESCCQRLPVTFFYGVHKSFYVNLHYVQKYAYSELFLTDGTRISIASRKQSEFHKFWFWFLGRH